MPRRSLAVLITGAAGAIYVIVSVAVQCVQVYVVGGGSWIGDSHLIPGTVPAIQGSGLWGDALRLAMMAVAIVLLLIAWAWLAQALGEDPPAVDSAGDAVAEPVDDDSWYLMRVPWLIRVMHGLAAFCIVAIALVGAALLPFIIAKFGWA
jgi:hypothetical protein